MLGRLLCGVALAAGLFVSSPVLAGTIEVDVGEIGFDLSINDVSVWSHAYLGTPNPTNPDLLTWGDGYWGNSNVMLEWSSVVADLDPFVSGSWAVTNNTNATQLYAITIQLPILPVLPSSLMYGSSSITVSDANGDGSATLGTFAGFGGFAMYTGRIDGALITPATELFPLGYSLTVGLLQTGSATQSFGIAPGSVPGPGANSSIGILHKFTLTPGDRATFNSVFSIVVPEASTLLLLVTGGAVFAILGRRRS